MPLCSATTDENNRPPFDKGGLQGVVLGSGGTPREGTRPTMILKLLRMLCRPGPLTRRISSHLPSLCKEGERHFQRGEQLS